MDLPVYLTFLFVSATQAATPGPSTVFIVNNSIAYGWRRALAALSGDLVAVALLATLSIIGLGALLMAYPIAFLALRLAGASYASGSDGTSFVLPRRGRTRGLRRPLTPKVDWGSGCTPSVWG
jgi:hypothetical protein